MNNDSGSIKLRNGLADRTETLKDGIMHPDAKHAE